MKIVLGVGGGIAAYKAAELARLLYEQGHRVQVVMTEAAQEFVRPLTFAALTGQKVITGLFPRGEADVFASSVEHIQVAQENEVLVVAPATADLLARFSHGLASDFLTTLYLAFAGPVVLAPAMNSQMWAHPATQANIAALRARGNIIVGPGEGPLACGMTGPGRMAEPAEIAEAVVAASLPKDLAGETVLVTAGPTQEPIDPVRYISNHSSGKMGYAIARAALARGANVILISGPVSLTPPAGARLVRVTTAEEMRRAVLEHLSEATIIVKAAAVADYRVAEPATEKLKKAALRLTLQLEPTPDILAELGKRKGDRLLIGFAAETGDLLAEARRKLESKNCDMIVANLVGREGTGFGADENEVTLVMRTGQVVSLPTAPKIEIAHRILDQAVKLRLAMHASQ